MRPKYRVRELALEHAAIEATELTAIITGMCRLLDGLFDAVCVVEPGDTAVIAPWADLDPSQRTVADCRAALGRGRLERPSAGEARCAWIACGEALDVEAALARWRPRTLFAGIPGETGWRVAIHTWEDDAIVGERGLDQLAGLLRGLVGEVQREPHRLLADYDMIGDPELLALYRVSLTREPEACPRFITRFTKIARTAGHRIAVQTGDEALTYADLDRASDKLGRELQRRGYRPGDRLMIIGDRSAVLVVAVVAAFKCGVAISIVDPRYPDGYLAECARAIGPRGVLDLPRRSPELPDVAVEPCWNPTLAEIAALPDAEPFEGEAFEPDDTAIITFTSGTAKAPKAVAGRYGSLTYFFDWMNAALGPFEDHRFGMCSSIAHDPLQRDIFTPLFLGAAIHIPSDRELTSPGRLPRWLARHAISTICVNPAMIPFLADPEVRLPDLRTIFLVGAALSKQHVLALRGIAPEARVVNLYGSTESQRAVGYVELPRNEAAIRRLPDLIPLGRGMKDVDLIVIDRRRDRLCAPFQLGEIAIRSRYIAKQYLNGTAEDDRRFAICPLTHRDDDRLYYTGDQGFLSPELGIIYGGRTDSQRKVRGHRIDLEQISATCRRHPQVRDAATIALEIDERTLLVAFLVPLSPLVEFKASAVKEYLRGELPGFMMVDRVVTLDAIPLTFNGKVDQPRLAELAAAETRRAPRAGGGGPLDRVVALIAQVTSADAIDVAEPLGRVGVDSLGMLMLAGKLSAEFGCDAGQAGLHGGMSAFEVAAVLEVAARSGGAAPVAAMAAGDPPAPLAPIDRLGPVVQVDETRIEFAGRTLDHFCSNSYLGFNRHPAIRYALARFAGSNRSIGGHGSFELNGYTRWHESLLAALREVYGCHTAVLYGSCYMANLSAISSLAGPDGQIFVEEGAHRSISDGCTLSRAKVRTFVRNDAAGLEQQLRGAHRAPGQARVIIAEAVSGLHGNLLDLPAIAALAWRYDATLYVDE